ncbi:sorting nexin-4-like [Planococcus citri]|uniref:sorting nexin-4-like n=1 Tax=Planococcus citri TaxID=170843 RepID=UPI0031F8F23D
MSETNVEKEKCLLGSLDISILEAEKRANPVLNIRDFFTAYLIESKVRDDAEENDDGFAPISLLWRRYSEFEQLQQYLQAEYPYVIIPPLPEKKHTYTWRNPNSVIHDITDPDFVDRRRAGLENFLHRVASHPLLSYDSLFKKFLTQENGWNETLKQEGYVQIVESKLKDLTVIPRFVSMDSQFKNLSNYSKQLENNLDSILKSRSKVIEQTYTVDMLHSHIGRLFSEWSVIEKYLGDGLQKAGHFIDTIASCTEATFQDEDVIVDQLKEYLFYTSSIDAVYKHHVRLQLQIENLKTSVKSKVEEKERIQQGKATVMARLFGALQTKEIRNEKVLQLDQRISEDENKIVELEESLKKFSELALEDFNRFQRQKDSDIQETLSSYVVQQIKVARRGLNAWINVKNCIETIP